TCRASGPPRSQAGQKRAGCPRPPRAARGPRTLRQRPRSRSSRSTEPPRCRIVASMPHRSAPRERDAVGSTSRNRPRFPSVEGGVHLGRALPVVVILLSGCTGPAPATRGLVREGTPDAVNIAAARERGNKRLFAWRPWGPEAFAEARRDHKLILLD